MSRWVLKLRFVILIIGLVGFLALTIPVDLANPFEPSSLARERDGGLTFAGRVLLSSVTGPEAMNMPAIERGDFGIDFTLGNQAPAHEVGIIAAYQGFYRYNWSVERHDTDIVIVHRSRAARFKDVIELESVVRYSVRISADGVSLFASPDRKGFAEWTAEPRPWESDARLTVGNSPYGDFPWTGTLQGLQLVVPDESANRQHRPLVFRLAPGTQDREPAFVGTDGRRIALRAYAWPWTLKLERLFSDLRQTAGPRDILGNLGLTFALGLGIAAAVSNQSTRRRMATVIIATAILSIGVEALQFFSPERVASFLDVLLNVTGALAGLAVWSLINGRSAVSPPPPDSSVR